MEREAYRQTYLRSAHWKRFRKIASERLPKVCPCGARSGLDLHHMTYERLGREHLDDVAWLCRGCHDALHVEDPNGGLFDPQRAAARPSHPSADQARRERAERVRIVNTARRKARKDPKRKRAIEKFSRRFDLRH